MQNPWTNIFDGDIGRLDRYSLKEERPVIDEFNKSISDEFKIYDTVFPSAYSNIKTSDILLLLTNPGYDQKEKDNGVYDDTERISQYLRNLIEDTVPTSEKLLSPYWEKKLNKLTKIYPLEIVKSHISIVQFFPYHSIKFREIPKKLIKKYFPNSNYLPSQEYTFHLLREALIRKPVIIITRSKKQWLEALPELNTYEYCFETNNYRNPILSENNFSKFPNAWKVINDKISVSVKSNEVQN
ncbi:MAG TPA: hypothetical protein VNW99_11605 [Cytophagaceae bacterium]|jgi:hypothetical protein|nr:hypothetical protein [Cytophagaceae bacterium]